VEIKTWQVRSALKRGEQSPLFFMINGCGAV